MAAAAQTAARGAPQQARRNALPAVRLAIMTPLPDEGAPAACLENTSAGVKDLCQERQSV